MTTAADTTVRVARANPVRAVLSKYYFAFALVLFVVLLVVNVVVQRDFGWAEQITVFAPLAIAAMASTPSIITGRGAIDISISPLMTFCSVVFAAVLLPAGLGGWMSVPLVLLLGAAIGVFNGLVIVFLRIPAVVVTLAMYFILAGLSLRIAPSSVSVGDNWVAGFGSAFGPVPGALVLIVIPLVIWAVLSRSLYGRQLFAVGGNDATALSSGVRVKLIRVVAFGIGGLFAGFGAFAMLSLLRIADPGQSTAYTLLGIAAVALGGTALMGGRGGVFGSLLGAGSIFLVQSLLGVLQVSRGFLGLFYGLVLLVAVVFGAALSRSGKDRS
jgi:ribose transport system permease protein